MRVLVTGGAGFIGSEVCRELCGLGHDVMIYDISGPRAGRFGGGDYWAGDILDEVELRGVMLRFNPSVVVHLAAVSTTRGARELPNLTYLTNVQGTWNVIRAIPGGCRLVFASSSMAYGDWTAEKMVEEAPLRPKELYGATKAAGEALIRGFCHNWVIVRPTAVYGPTDCNGRVSEVLLENAVAGKPLVLRDPEALLDFTYVKDAAHGFVLAALTPGIEGQTFNISAGRGRTLREYAGILRQYFPGLTIQEESAEAGLPKRGGLDINRAEAILGYDPKYYHLEDGLAEYVAWRRGLDADTAG